MQASCPVCHMPVEAETAPAKTEYEGQTYYFCGSACKESFEKDPGKFAGGHGGHEHHHHH